MSLFLTNDFLSKLDPQERAAFDGAIRCAFEPDSDGQFECEVRFRRPNQELRWLYAKGKAIFTKNEADRSATRMVGTLLDRTEQRLAQHALLEAEQLAATGRLAASIAHEINNPLEAVTNLLYLLRGEKQT